MTACFADAVWACSITKKGRAGCIRGQVTGRYCDSAYHRQLATGSRACLCIPTQN